jgi:hypothetical protein
VLPDISQEQQVTRFKRLTITACVTASCIATAAAVAEQDKSALALQDSRNQMVAETGKTIHYGADRFDLSDLPAYVPQQKVTGTIRIAGNNYIGDSPLGKY